MVVQPLEVQFGRSGYFRQCSIATGQQEHQTAALRIGQCRSRPRVDDTKGSTQERVFHPE
jgi:hypothetical protein